MRLTRRQTLGAMAAAMGLPTTARAGTQSLPPWRPGLLDIHHIDTGRGNATFILAPDGTTLLIDCGEVRAGRYVQPLHPDDSRRPGEWVARYALRHARAAGRSTLDYAVATHVHPDHVGDPMDRAPLPGEQWVRTGLSDVDALMPIEQLIDRGFPDYPVIAPPKAPFTENHLAWLRARASAGRATERAIAGSVRQIVPRRQPGLWSARILAASGQLWTGEGEHSRAIFPPETEWTAQARPGENSCSVALRLDYGRFSYFAGGDIDADSQDGTVPWLDVESRVAAVAGQVSVAAADHHGYFDAVGPGAVAHLAPRVWVVPAWHASHPAPAQLQRMEGAWPGQRETVPVYVTRLDPVAEAVNERFLKGLAGVGGHVVVRASKDGAFDIFMVDSRDESDRVDAVRSFKA